MKKKYKKKSHAYMNTYDGLGNSSSDQPNPTYTPDEAKSIQQKRQDKKKKKNVKVLQSKLKKSLQSRKF